MRFVYSKSREKTPPPTIGIIFGAFLPNFFSQFHILPRLRCPNRKIAKRLLATCLTTCAPSIMVTIFPSFQGYMNDQSVNNNKYTISKLLTKGFIFPPVPSIIQARVLQIPAAAKQILDLPRTPRKYESGFETFLKLLQNHIAFSYPESVILHPSL